MGLSVRRKDGVLRVETSQLALTLQLDTLAFGLSWPAHGVQMRGARPRVLFDRGSLEAHAPVLDGHGDIRSRLGIGTRIHARARTHSPLDFILEIDVGDDWPGIVIGLSIENRGDRPQPLRTIEPFYFTRDGGGELRLPGDPRDLRLFRLGYQSWSPADYVPLSVRDARPRNERVQTVHWGPFTPLPADDLHVSDFATTIGTPHASGLVLGFLTHLSWLTHISVRHAGTRIDEIRSVCATEDLAIAPRTRFEAERLWVALDPPDGSGMAGWADRAGKEMQAPVPARGQPGWCSWYQYFTDVTAEDVRRNLRDLRDLDTGISTFQIDDGYQPAVGDWLEPSAGFPDGIAPLAAEIRREGFKPGLWVAPFLASRDSRLVERHPDWLLRDALGQAIVGVSNPAWPGRVCHVLDPTHPEARDWLAELAHALAGMGFEMLKLDFLYAGALPGRRHDPTVPSARAYRAGLRSLRDAVPFLLGCGAPLGPSIGMVEAMRIGPDTAPYWHSKQSDRSFGIRASPGVENSLRNTLARAALHQRLWINDPDCVLLRDTDTALTETEVCTLAAVNALSGGLFTLSDEIAHLGPQRRALLRRLLPTLDRSGETPAPAEGTPDRMWCRFPDGSALALAVNFARTARAVSIDPSDLGFEDAVHIWDVWGQRDMGLRKGPVEIDGVPSHGSLLLRISPADGRARLVGSTLHIGAGSIEASRIKAHDDGTVSVKLALPGQQRGRVAVLTPAGRAFGIHVSFSDEVEFGLEGVEEVIRIPDA